MASLPFDTELISDSPAQTEDLAARLYRLVKPVAIIALYGPLGAGKTCFVRGVARAAGVNPDDVNSPSFTLVNEYPGGETPIFHLDLFRLTDPSEFYSIGGDDYLSLDGIILIEWAENGRGFIPDDRFDVHFDIIDENRRRVIFSKRTP